MKSNEIMWRSDRILVLSALRLIGFPTDTRKSRPCISDFKGTGTARATESILALMIGKTMLHLEENMKTLLLKVRPEDNQHGYHGYHNWLEMLALRPHPRPNESKSAF